MAFVLALAIGFSGGLRSMMPLAAVRFPKHDWTSILFALFALAELAGDKLPSAPARTAWYAVALRILTGGFGGAAVFSALGGSFALGALIGAAGALAGTYGGYAWRTRVRERLGGPDIVYALVEDVVSIALAFGVALRVLT